MPSHPAERPTVLGGVIEIVSAHLANNAVALSEVEGFIRAVHSTLTELERHELPQRATVAVEEMRGLCPAVPVHESIQSEYIICLEDGKRLRVLKRYLMTQYGLTPEAYREKWGLPADYPMVAPAVSQKRSADAKQAGFGKDRKVTKPAPRRKRPLAS